MTRIAFDPPRSLAAVTARPLDARAGAPGAVTDHEADASPASRITSEAAAETASEAAADGATASAPGTTPAAPVAAAAVPRFADVDHAQADWDALAVAADAGPATAFAASRVRSHFGRAEPTAARRPGAAPPPRCVTLVPRPGGLAAAAAWNLLSTRTPIHRVTVATLTGARDPGRPGVALVDPAGSAEDQAAAWTAMLQALAADSAPELVECGPLVAGGPEAEALVAALAAEDAPFHVVGSHLAGAIGQLPVVSADDDGAPPWARELRETELRSRATLGPVHAHVVDDPEAVAAEVLAADAMLRRRPGTAEGLDAIPEGRSLALGLTRCCATDVAMSAVAVRLEHAGEVVARACALVGGDRATALVVGRTASPAWAAFGPGRQAFGRLLTALADRGVRRIETGPAGLWFHERAGDGHPGLVPTLTWRLVSAGPGQDRGRAFIGSAELLSRVPAVGPAAPLVRLARRWATGD